MVCRKNGLCLYKSRDGRVGTWGVVRWLSVEAQNLSQLCVRPRVCVWRGTSSRSYDTGHTLGEFPDTTHGYHKSVQSFLPVGQNSFRLPEGNMSLGKSMPVQLSMPLETVRVSSNTLLQSNKRPLYQENQILDKTDMWVHNTMQNKTNTVVMITIIFYYFNVGIEPLISE